MISSRQKAGFSVEWTSQPHQGGIEQTSQGLPKTERQVIRRKGEKLHFREQPPYCKEQEDCTHLGEGDDGKE